MKKLYGYIMSSFHNIKKNKLYSLFYVIGTALTFVFIILILQFVKLIATATAPNLNADRIISITSFQNTKGEEVSGIPPVEITQLMQNIKVYEKYSFVNDEIIFASTNNQVVESLCLFAGGDYFKMYQFNFIEGRPFTKEDVEQKNKVAVIKESLAKSHYPNGKAVGNTITLQGNTYKIIGVASDYSTFVLPEAVSLWVPASYNKFIPSNNNWYRINIQFPASITKDEMKENLANNLRAFYQNKNIEINISKNDIYTQQENKIKNYFSGYILYGIGSLLFLLLFIPALNITVLSITQTESRQEEMAIKRAIGATRTSAFWQLISENFILVLIGIIIGCIITMPSLALIQRFISGDILADQVPLISEFDFSVIVFQVFPLALLFVFLSGGIPAFLVSRKNISLSLKGGNKV